MSNEELECPQCHKKPSEVKAMMTSSEGTVCNECAEKLFHGIATWLRQHGRDVAVVEFTWETTGGRHREFRVYDDSGRAKELVSETYLRDCHDSAWQGAYCLGKILGGIREVLRPHELKTVDGEIVEAKQRLAEMEKKRALIESKTQFEKA